MKNENGCVFTCGAAATFMNEGPKEPSLIEKVIKAMRARSAANDVQVEAKRTAAAPTKLSHNRAA